MNKKQLKILLTIVAIIVVIIIIVINLNNKGKTENIIENKNSEEYTVQQDGNKLNTSEALKKPRNELGYYVKNITMKTEGVQTIFKLDIQNQSSTIQKGKLVDVVFIDKNGTEQTRIALYIREIKAGETITTQGTICGDITNVYNFKLVERTK